MFMGVAVVLLLAVAALALGIEDQTRPRVESSATPESRRILISNGNATTSAPHIAPRSNHTPVVDSLVPTSNPVMPADHKQLTTAIVVFVLAFVGLCTVATSTFFLVRCLMRRAAVKRRRQASWILRTGQWNMESKRSDSHETRTGCSDTSSAFSAYPYPLSEHF